MNLRLGIARERVTEAARFAALAYRYRWRDHAALGIGYARTGASSELVDPDLDDSSQIELFGSFTLDNGIYLTVSIQHLRHSGFVAEPTDPRHAVVAGGLRLHYAF